MRILVATDGSECADTAVDLVAALEWPPGSTIHVVEATTSGIAVFGGPWPPIPPVDTTSFDASILEQAQQRVEVAATRLAAPGRSVETSIASGRAADVITSIAEQVGAGLIVLGSRGHGTLETMLLGSVSSEVVDHAYVPVLVARSSSIDRIVLAWDGSASAEQAAQFLIDCDALAKAEILVLSVADIETTWWPGADMFMEAAPAATYVEAAPAATYVEAAELSRSQHKQLAAEMADRLHEAALSAVPEQRDGDPAAEIVRLAQEREADLVIVGTHGRTGLSRLLMGSVARNVLLHAPCSVLVVRSQRPGGAEIPPGIA